MSHRINVAVIGAAGKMGREVCRAVLAESRLALVGAVDRDMVGTSLRDLMIPKAPDLALVPRIDQSLFTEHASVAVDFTHPKSARANVEAILKAGMHAVVGTTGLDEDAVAEIREISHKTGKNVLIAPNFAIGAVILMRFAEMAARYMKAAEIIELHHDKKAEAPSGTALMTASLIGRVHKGSSKDRPPEIIKINGVRGGSLDGVPIHSVRLPGLVAHQEVIFGDVGQVLTLRHDSLSRESFMPGVLIGIRDVSKHKGVTIGLDQYMKWA